MGQLGNAVGAIREITQSSENMIVESNSIMQFWRPDLYLFVADFGIVDFKDSALRYLDRADCLVPVSAIEPRWTGVSLRLWESKPRFPVHPPHYVNSDLNTFVERRLRGQG